MRLKYYFVLLFFTSSLLAQSYIDVITLKNGDLIKGKIIENVLMTIFELNCRGGQY